jgi:hypothetical protein
VRRRASPLPVGRPGGTADSSFSPLARASDSVAESTVATMSATLYCSTVKVS